MHFFDRFVFYVQDHKKSHKIINDFSIMQHVIGKHNAFIGVKRQMASENGVTYALKLMFIQF